MARRLLILFTPRTFHVPIFSCGQTSWIDVIGERCDVMAPTECDDANKLEDWCAWTHGNNGARFTGVTDKSVGKSMATSRSELSVILRSKQYFELPNSTYAQRQKISHVYFEVTTKCLRDLQLIQTLFVLFLFFPLGTGCEKGQNFKYHYNFLAVLSLITAPYFRARATN